MRWSLLRLLLVLCWLGGGGGGFAPSAASPAEAAALLALLKCFKVTRQGSCVASSWTVGAGDSSSSSSSCPSTFCGVSCSQGSVVGIDLSGHGLQGIIAPNILSKLTMLSSLNLSHNLLSGEIPSDIGNLTRLQSLDLSDNSFSGEIPPEIADASALRLLNFSHNSLSGSIAPSLSRLSSLQSLDLHHNLLDGEISPSLLVLSELSSVDLSSNQLSGFIPWQPNDTLPLLSVIEYVNLSRNELAGPLAPAKFSSVFAERLRVLDVSHNKLSGDLPDFEFVMALSVLRLNDNLFTGSVPPTLLSSTMSLLEELDLSSNNVTGVVERVQSTSLKFLNLSFNALSGQLPAKLGSCSVVDLSHNSFDGNLSSLTYWTDMVEDLRLSSNQITGMLPDDVSKFVRLRVVDVSDNRLSGSIPSSYGTLPKLNRLDLSSNQLNGPIPASLFSSATVSYLLLSNNKLNGQIPAPPPASSTVVLVMDLSNNELSGTIPEGIGRIQALVELRLNANGLVGRIPDAISNLTHLQILDLSDNRLTGPIPAAMPATLSRLELSGNNLTGEIPDELRKFPNSSFYPGNGALIAPWPLSAGPGVNSLIGSSFMERRRSIGADLKAGMIAGSTAGAALLIFAGILVYCRRMSKSEEDDNKVTAATKACEMWSPCAAYSAGGGVAGAVVGHSHDANASKHFSADLLLEEVVVDKAETWQERMQETEETVKQKGRLDLSPSAEAWRRRRRNESPAEGEAAAAASASPVVLKVQSPDKLAGELHFLDKSLRFTAEELSRAPAEVLGRSSHGTSYKATLDSGHSLTVKWLREGLAKGKREFGREASKYGKVRHPNLIPLRGYYWGPREHEKLILSDFVSTGSLAAHIADRSGQRYPPLSWRQRVVVAVDAARGLMYLHEEKHLPHGNVKATNVLIEGPSFGARLADYGLHTLMTGEGTASQMLNAAALGYRAPELAAARRPRPTFRGDVYALGVIMLELLTGQGAGDIMPGQSRAVDLTDWVRLLASEERASDCLDPALVGAAEAEFRTSSGGGERRRRHSAAAMEEMLRLALRCISPQAADRPGIRSIYEELAGICA